MIWLNVLKILLGMASELARYLQTKQILDAGEARAVAYASAVAARARRNAARIRASRNKLLDKDYRD